MRREGRGSGQPAERTLDARRRRFRVERKPESSINLLMLGHGSVKSGREVNQCDQIWQIFASFLKNLKSLAI